MLQAPNTDLFNPLVPKVHNSESKNLLFPCQCQFQLCRCRHHCTMQQNAWQNYAGKLWIFRKICQDRSPRTPLSHLMIFPPPFFLPPWRDAPPGSCWRRPGRTCRSWSSWSQSPGPETSCPGRCTHGDINQEVLDQISLCLNAYIPQIRNRALGRGSGLPGLAFLRAKNQIWLFKKLIGLEIF